MCTMAAVVEGIKPCYYKKKDKDRAQKPAAMNSCFGLVRPHQYGTGSHTININVMGNGRVVEKWLDMTKSTLWLLSTIFIYVYMLVALTYPFNTLTQIAITNKKSFRYSDSRHVITLLPGCLSRRSQEGKDFRNFGSD